MQDGAFVLKPEVFAMEPTRFAWTSGHVRTIGEQPQAIRALKADPTPGLQAYVDNAFGWHRDGTRWVGVHLSDKYQDPHFISGIDYTVEWLRTTLVKKDGIWVMVEYCERVSEMVEPNRFIEETPGKTTVVTFLTDGFEDVEAMGFGVEGVKNELYAGSS